jgi:hypothetical protein
MPNPRLKSKIRYLITESLSRPVTAQTLMPLVTLLPNGRMPFDAEQLIFVSKSAL